MKRHFLTLHDYSTVEIKHLISSAISIKNQLKTKTAPETLPLSGHSLCLIFSKPSTRTRVSAEIGWNYFGGHSMFLGQSDIQLGYGEPISDTARVVSSMSHCILARLGNHQDIEALAQYSSVPVINALTDSFHPLQALADIQTICEAFPTNTKTNNTSNLNSNIPISLEIPKIKVAWIGDANNVLNSLLVSMPRLGIRMAVATPKDYNPPWFIKSFANLSSNVTWHHNPLEAVKDADVIMTDTWISMGQEDEKIKRLSDFKDFQITNELAMRGGAKKDWKFMHCLPRKLEEVDSEVFYDSSRSLVWLEAENRKSTIMAVYKKVMGFS